MKYLPALILLIAAIGCAPANPMVGTWKFQKSPSSKERSEAKLTFNFSPNGTWTGTSDTDGKVEKANGTYKIKEKELTMSISDVDGTRTPSNEETHFTLNEDLKSFDMPGSGQGKIVKQ